MAVYYIGSQPFGYNDLSHHGILGMKWGIRRFQNPDGTLTAEGKARYRKRYGIDDHKPDFIERGFGRKIKQYESYYEGERKALNKSLIEGKQSKAKRHYANMIGFEIARRSEKKLSITIKNYLIKRKKL